MMVKFAGWALLMMAAPLFAQNSAEPAAPSAPAPAPAPRPATVKVILTTSDGPITLELEKERAPVTTANFLRYVDQKRLDGTTFYRAVNIQEGYGFIQGGVRNDPKRVLKPIAHEPTSQTGLHHMEGSISMARGAPGTASGDFFITLGSMPSMDADPTKPGDNLGFAVFGQVTDGMDAVKKILVEPTSPTAGVGVMKGQMLAAPVRIVSARRVPN
jgi:peptidyl-prolyl cis-trans isomerase A (cyclophilin A)